MQGLDDPFAQFAFQAPAAKRSRVTGDQCDRINATGAQSSASLPPLPPPLPPPRPSTLERTRTKSERLIEYALIKAFRSSKHASVDDFHAFLISLGSGGDGSRGERDGRFWALIACLLSVQCRDSVALDVTRSLMTKCAGGSVPAAARVAALPLDEIESAVQRCNFYKTKAKNVLSAARHALARGGRPPSTYDELLALEGVGPKIAHLLRSVAYGHEDAGIVVDTHVFRVAQRLRWVDAATAAAGAEAVRAALERWVPTEERVAFSLALVGFGQHTRSGEGWGTIFVDEVQRSVAACEESFDGDAEGTQVSMNNRGGGGGSGGSGAAGVARASNVMPPFLSGVAASMVERMDAKPS
jgi:endonuclease-3